MCRKIFSVRCFWSWERFIYWVKKLVSFWLEVSIRKSIGRVKQDLTHDWSKGRKCDSSLNNFGLIQSRKYTKKSISTPPVLRTFDWHVKMMWTWKKWSCKHHSCVINHIEKLYMSVYQNNSFFRQYICKQRVNIGFAYPSLPKDLIGVSCSFNIFLANYFKEA